LVLAQGVFGWRSTVDQSTKLASRLQRKPVAPNGALRAWKLLTGLKVPPSGFFPKIIRHPGPRKFYSLKTFSLIIASETGQDTREDHPGCARKDKTKTFNGTNGRKRIMNTSMKRIGRFGNGVAVAVAGVMLAGLPTGAPAAETAGAMADTPDLAAQIFDVMLQVHGVKSGFRPVHAKGVVCDGEFLPTADAAKLSKATHFQGPAVPVTIRFSDGSPEPTIPDNAPNAGPRGFAIRFKPAGSRPTDIVAMSHHGFVVGNPGDFLALEKSVVATDPSEPHPWPVETFLGTHPLAMKFVVDNRAVPQSFATEAFFSNDSFIFVNKDGAQQAIRYQILPVAGQHDLSEDDAKAKGPDYLVDDLKAMLAKGPIKFRLVAQIPNEGDQTKDPSLVWPPDRKTVDLGMISVTAMVADSDAAQKTLAFTPSKLIDGIEYSDDPFPELRGEVYSLSVDHRQQ
jgi:catalase